MKCVSSVFTVIGNITLQQLWANLCSKFYCLLFTLHDMIWSIVNEQSGSQFSSLTSPPNFCYVLAVHESSRVSLCQDVHCQGTKTLS